jgi:hypothetical protein
MVRILVGEDNELFGKCYIISIVFYANPDPTKHFDTDPDPIVHKVLHILENQTFFIYFYSQR